MPREKGVLSTTWWDALSIRARLSLSYGSALGAMLLIYAIFVLATVRERIGVEVDHRLDQEVEIAEQALTRDTAGRLSWKLSGGSVDGYVTLANMLWVDVHLTDGTFVHKIAGGYANNGNVETLPFARRSPGFFSTKTSGVSLRVLQREVEIEGVRAVIRAAFPEAQIEREMASLLWVLTVGFPLAIGAAGVAGYWLAGRALAPVAEMTDEAQSITAERLDARLPIANPNDEFGRLGTTINDLFARLENSFEQLRRFTSDVSHELRTPLTIIRSVGEVALREHHDEAGYREIIGAMLEESDRLAQLVQSLLTLARADAGGIIFKPVQFDLAELVKATATHLQILAEEKSQQLLVENHAGHLLVMGDQSVLRQAILNILDNAIKYSPENGRIKVVVSSNTDTAIVEIEDSGPGIAPEHQTKVFDRFYRIDLARNRKEGGFGLGLAIARWAIEANGGKIVVRNGESCGSVFRMTLPLPNQECIKQVN